LTDGHLLKGTLGKLLEEINERIDQFVELPQNIMKWTESAIQKIEGHKKEDILPPWIEIFESPHKNKFVLAARQTAKSVYAALKLLFVTTAFSGKSAVYITYDETNLSHFSNQKLRRGIIAFSFVIRSMLKKNERGEIAFNNSSAIFLVTDEGEYKHAEGKSPDIVILDESQYQTIQFLSILRETMSYSQGALEILGRGGEEGSDYQIEWEKTDQREWDFDDPNWRDKLQFGPNGLIRGEYLQDVMKGHWRATKPQNYLYAGYHLPQTIFPHIPLTISDAIHKYRIPPEFSIEWKIKNYPKSILLAHVYATFYKAMRRPITPAMVRACMENYRDLSLMTAEEVISWKQIFGPRMTVLMGVDWGSSTSGNASTVISIILKIRSGATEDTSRYYLAYIHKIERGAPGEPEMGIEEAAFIVKLFNDYGVDHGVADLGYGEIQVKAIQEGGIHPKTNERFKGLSYRKFMGCKTIQDLTAPEQDKLGKADAEVDETTRYQVDKTHIIENFVNFIGWYVNYLPMNSEKIIESFGRPKLMIPYADDLKVEWLINEWTGITRKDLEKNIEVKVDDPRQMPKKEYNHPPDSAMSIIYCMIADANYRPGGADFKGAFTGTRRNTFR